MDPDFTMNVSMWLLANPVSATGAAQAVSAELVARNRYGRKFDPLVLMETMTLTLPSESVNHSGAHVLRTPATGTFTCWWKLQLTRSALEAMPNLLSSQLVV